MVRLRDHLTVLWRAPGEVQIGLDPRCGVVVAGLTEPEERLLDTLHVDRTVSDVVRSARGLGIGAAQARRLLDTLGRAGVLCPDAPPPPQPSRVAPTLPGRSADAAYWARLRPDADGWGVVGGRWSRTVAVLGVGRLGMLVASGLAAAGCGTVLLSDPARVLPGDVAPGAFGPQDVGRVREDAAVETLHAIVPEVSTSAPQGVRPDVAVLVEHGVASPVRARPLVREDVPHLSVVVGEVDVVVGPLVVPGHGPCLRCLDLHRCDADPRWPAVATQVAATAGPDVESSLAPLAAALAVGQVLAHLDGRPPGARAATLEVSALDAVPARRAWTTHPECGCDRPPPARP